MIAKKRVIHVHFKKAHVDEYKRLLRANWTRRTVDDTLALLERAAPEASTLGDESLIVVRSNGKSRKSVSELIIERSRELADVFCMSPLPPVPKQIPTGRKEKAAAQAESVWTFLLLRLAFRMSGANGLFRDLQSLLFLASVHFLLPPLRAQGMFEHHDYLLNALYLHTVLDWRDEAPHCFYLQSLIMDYVGAVDQRLKLLDLSFRLTSITDHSYLTKATALWSEFVDAGRIKQARRFLMAIARTAPTEHQAEIAEMLDETEGTLNRA